MIAWLRKKRRREEPLSLDAALARARARDPAVGTVIDVGASDGRWSRVAARHFPEARFLLVEAQAVHEPPLGEIKRADGRFDYVIAAASDACGSVHFEGGDPFGGVASHDPDPGNARMIEVPAVTVDALVRDRRLAPPFLLKLDTHGFEIPILEGAAAALREAHSVIIETYNFHVAGESLLFWEMCGYMRSKGFRCIDMCEPLFRPRDGALWQFDLFFAPAGRPEFASNRYE